MATDDCAIVVGIQTYPGIGSLEGPCRDALLFAEWLEKTDGGDLPGERIETCLSTDFSPPPDGRPEKTRPDREDIEGLFRPFLEKGVRGEHAGRRLYLFVSGHGFSDAAESYKNVMNTALYTANAGRIVGLHVAITSYAEWIAQSAVFDEIVLIMDCCRTKSLLHSYTCPQLPSINPNPSKTHAVRKFYAFAAPWGHAAKEKAMPHMNNDVYGIFTVALMEALEKARPNRQGNLKGEDVKQYIHNVIDGIAGETAISPPEIYLGTGQDIIWLKRRSSAKRHIPEVTIRLESHTGTEVCVIANGRLEELHRIPFEENKLLCPLEPGLYKISIAGTDRHQLVELLNDDIEITL